MVNVNSFLMIMLLAFLASCAPIDQRPINQAQIDKTQKTPVITKPEIKPEEIKELEDTEIKDTKPLIAEVRPLDNQTVEAPLQDNDTKKDTAIEIAPEEINALDDNTTSLAIDKKPPEPLKIITPKVIPAPKPIEPLNPVIFTGLTIQKLETRLGRPDRQFNEQALDIWHYEEPHCHALFFIHHRGDSAEVMHVDVRAAILQSPLNRQVCFADFGQRAEALLNRDKR